MVYEVKSFRGGISDYEDKGILGAFKFGYGLDIRKTKDSLSCQQALVDEGLDVRVASESTSPSSSFSPSPSASESPSPSNTPSYSVSASQSPSQSASPSASKSPSSSPSPSPARTSVFRDLIRFFVKATDGNTYGFGSTGWIYRRTPEAYWQAVYQDPDGAIKGAEEKPSDSKKTYLVWTTDKSVKKKELPGNMNWGDVVGVSDGLSSAEWHTIRQINGGIMIANRSWLALMGYDDSFTNEALDLIPGNLSKTLVERNGRIIIGTAKENDPTRGVNGAIDSEFPLAQVGVNGEIYFANMSDTMPAKRFPGGGKCNPGGVCNEVEQVNFFEWEDTALSWIDKQSVGNMAMFAIYDADAGKGGVYTYGRKVKDHPFVLNLEYLLDADELGAVVNTGGTTLVSYVDGTTFGVMASDPNNKATGCYEGLDFKSPVKIPASITTWKQAELFFKSMPAGASLEFWYRVNKDGYFIRAYTADGQTSFSIAGAKKALFRIEREGEVFESKVMLYPSGNNDPEVHRIRVYFE